MFLHSSLLTHSLRSLLLSSKLRDVLVAVKMHSYEEEKLFFLNNWEMRCVRESERERGATWFGGCRHHSGCLLGDSVMRSCRADEATHSLLCCAAHSLSACHYTRFSQLARTRNSELKREKLTAPENRRGVQWWRGKNRNISFVWWLLIIPGSRRRVAENSLIS